ncbi:MAG: hypothetical protein Q8S17_13525, partial [Humidesulfovibrio sp.]|nr:hypothetical protein [Humidesulfovibrio sp.]
LQERRLKLAQKVVGFFSENFPALIVGHAQRPCSALFMASRMNIRSLPAPVASLIRQSPFLALRSDLRRKRQWLQENPCHLSAQTAMAK